MIQCYKFQGKVVEEVDGMKDAHWIHLCPPFNEETVASYAEKFGVPVDFIQDSLDIDERSRYEIEDEGKLILINTPTINQTMKENEAIYVTIPIGIILVDKMVITVSQPDNPIIERILNHRFRSFIPSEPSLFVLLIFQQNVLWFLECLKRLNLKRNLIEQELYDSSRNKELRQLLKIEKSLVYFVNSLSANDLLMMKMKRTDFLRIRDHELQDDLFEDIIIDNGQALEMSNVYTNILSGTMEAYASIISNNMNTFIHRLTIITIILMVPTLVASFYGMNLEYLPLSSSKYAFVLLLVFSIILGFLLILFLGKTNRYR